MRGLMTAVIGMGVLIAVGTTVLVVLLVQRMSSAAAPNASAVASAPAIANAADPAGTTLDEPAGTHVAGTSLAGDRLAVQLSGGGPDRIAVVDTRTGRVVARVSLGR